jgi:hypothetical protein
MPLDGECIKETFYLIKDNPNPIINTLPLLSSTTNECCGAFSFKVLADTTDANEFKNDKTDFLWWFSDFVTDAEIELKKFNGSTYETVTDLNNNDYGVFLPYGSFINASSEKFVGYTLDWRNVIADFDTGSYKLLLTINSPLGQTEILTDEYCVQNFTEQRANNTIKLEYYLNGIMGVNNDDLKKRDYGNLNRYNSIRLPGWFGFPNSKYTKDYTVYNNGSRQWVQDEQEQEFVMQIKNVSAKVHELMRTDILQADQILVTDYNKNNAQQWIKKSVQITSDYPPEWKLLQSKLAPVKLTFRSAVNNLKKFRD